MVGVVQLPHRDVIWVLDFPKSWFSRYKVGPIPAIINGVMMGYGHHLVSMITARKIAMAQNDGHLWYDPNFRSVRSSNFQPSDSCVLFPIWTTGGRQPNRQFPIRLSVKCDGSLVLGEIVGQQSLVVCGAQRGLGTGMEKEVDLGGENHRVISLYSYIINFRGSVVISSGFKKVGNTCMYIYILIL